MLELKSIIDKLANEEPLPEHCRPHLLHGDWKGCWDCHILNDWVLIYEIDPVKREITFRRTGTHSDLFN